MKRSLDSVIKSVYSKFLPESATAVEIEVASTCSILLHLTGASQPGSKGLRNVVVSLPAPQHGEHAEQGGYEH